MLLKKAFKNKFMFYSFFFFIVIFIYIKISKNLLAKYHQENKKRLRKASKRYQNLS